MNNLLKEEIEEKTSILEESYKYDQSTWISVSNIKDYLSHPFDTHVMAIKTRNAHYEDKNSKYYHMDVPEIETMWEDAANKGKANGSNVDLLIEHIYNDEDSTEFEHSATKNNPELAKKFEGVHLCLNDMKSRGINFDCREMKLLFPYEYNGKTYVINGRLDALFSINDEKNILIDWKNTEKIKETNGYERLNGPLSNLDDCDANLYTVQLFIYKYILEDVYGLRREFSPFIVQFPSNAEYRYRFYPPWFKYDRDLVKKIIEYAIARRIEDTAK